MLLEICVDSIESALAAQNGGANRVELCGNLNIGGTTPSQGLIELAKEHLTIDIFVMIRPRGGDFCYSDLEFEVMKKDIINAKKLQVDGIVLGILEPNGKVDVKRMKELIDLSHPLKVTFHRAFDRTRDLFESLEDLITLGVERILTSGGEDKVINGLDTLKRLVKQANGRIIIMPGSGVNIDNVEKIINETKVKEIHLSARDKLESKMDFRSLKISGKLTIAEYANYVSSERIVNEISKRLEQISDV